MPLLDYYRDVLQIFVFHYHDNNTPCKPTLKVKVTSGSSSTIRILLRNGSFVSFSFTLAVSGF
jgi:hypothetical protein